MRKLKACSDEVLLAMLVDHDMVAFEEIYYRYWERLYSATYKRISLKEDAEEIVQDIFTSLWAGRSKNTIQNLSAYLFTAVKYKVIHYYEKQKVKATFFEARSSDEISSTNTTEETILWNELNEAIEKQISKLPDRCLQVYKLSRQEHLSMKQVASQLNISEKTVENQLSKAVKVLRTNLKHFIFFLVFITIS